MPSRVLKVNRNILVRVKKICLKMERKKLDKEIEKNVNTLIIRGN